jgi:hypothetical protein
MPKPRKTHESEGLQGFDTSLSDGEYDCLTREEYYRNAEIETAKHGRLDGAKRRESHAHAKPRRHT